MPSIDKDAVMPSNAEVEQAKSSISQLAEIIKNQSGGTAGSFILSQGSTTVCLSRAAVQALLEVVHVISEGNAVKVDAIEKIMTTGKAAELLNVSRPFFCKLLDSGEISHYMVGKFRRVRYEDVLAYKKKRMARQKGAMEKLVAQAQELKMGY